LNTKADTLDLKILEHTSENATSSTKNILHFKCTNWQSYWQSKISM